MCNDVLLVLATLNKEVPPYSRNRTRFLQRIDTLLGHQRDGLRLNFGLAMQMHRRSYNSASIRPAAGGAGVGGGIGGGGGGQGGRGRGMAVTSAGQQNSSQPIALYNRLLSSGSSSTQNDLVLHIERDPSRCIMLGVEFFFAGY